MSGALVREARAEDLEALAPALCDLPLLRSYDTTVGSLCAQLQAARERGEGLLVVEREGAPAGLAWFLDGGRFALGGYLRLIALVDGAHGEGLGGLLLDEVERRTAMRSRHLFLLCTAGNDGARRFYERRGYRESGSLPGLVRPDLDEVIFWKRLR